MAKLIWKPNEGPQTAFLSSTVREILYGGAVAGGKSDALLVCDLRWADHPKHRSILLRRTRPQLQESIDRALQLYPDIVPGANWQEGKSRWEMPSGAIYQFGYAEHEKDILGFKSFEYNVVKFDELTSFTEQMYKFMFLRNRTKSADLPLWIRSGTNPGDVGHEWVFNRFIYQRAPYEVYQKTLEIDGVTLTTSQQYIPSRIWDNPAMPNREEYIANILEMSEEDIAAYLYGQWTKLAGAMFKTLPTELPTRQIFSHNYYIIRSIDYGWNDHTAALWLVVYNDGAVIDIVGEVYVNETGADQVAYLIKKKEEELGLGPAVYSIGSPEMGRIEGTSGQSIASIMAINGAAVVPAKGTQSSRKTGWANLQRWLQSGRLRVWPGAAPNLMRTLPLMMRDPKNPEDIRPRQEDHAADSLRYALMAVVDKPVQIVAPRDPLLDNPNFDHRFDQLVKELGKQRGMPWS